MLTHFAASVAPFASLALMPEPVTPAAVGIRDLFMIIFWIAMVVGVLVEVALIYTIWKWRHNPSLPKGEHERGNAKVEVIWTIVPALILVGIGLLTLQTMSAIEIDAPTPDFEVGVTGQQFAWSFEYPDKSTSFENMYVESGSTVGLTIHSVDVIHSFNILGMGVKIDAIPGRTNHFWFKAPEVTQNTEFHMQCTAYCGLGHAYMTGKVVVFPKGKGVDGKPYGEPVASGGGQSGGGIGEVSETWNVKALNSLKFEIPECGSGPNPTCKVKPGQTIQVNFDSEGFHNFALQIGSTKLVPIACCVQDGSKTATFTVPADAAVGTKGEYWCDPHKTSGMKGALEVVAG